jgi:hypothetical protein
MTTAAVIAPRLLAYLYALIVAAGIGHFLLGIPIQLTDSYGNMVKLATPWRDLLIGEFSQRSYLRPFLWAELKLVYDASGGNYFPWFRGVHVAQVCVLLLLFVRLLRPATWRDAAILPLAVAILIGMHTFTGTVVEAFPVNTFLTILLCCLAAANLALAPPRWWVDVLAALLFILATLTVESGLLIWVIFVGAAIVGAGGVSRPGLAVLTVLLAGYFVLRFAVLEVGSPGLIERSSGYGFHSLEPDDLVARFGENPGWFYLYNIATSVLSVLFSEPRGGVFRLIYGITLRDPEPSAIVNVIACTCATALLAVFAWRRRRDWLAWRFERDDQLVLLFVMVLIANATISYPYTKDVIMSPAGIFFAVAVFAAARHVLPAASANRPVWKSAAAGAFCLVLACAWSVRALTVHLNLREAARKTRVEWAYADDWLRGQQIVLTDTRQLSLFRTLQADAVYRRPAPPRLPLADYRIFDVD